MKSAFVSIVLAVITAGVLTVAGCSRTGGASKDFLGGQPVSGQLTFPGLTADVEVATDIYGIPHIYATNINDLVFAQGYVTARDRFVQMDITRKFAEGKLSEVLGGVLSVDTDMKAAFTGPDGADVIRQNLDRVPDDYRIELERYTDGVNQYISDIKAGRNGLKPPAQYGSDKILFGLDSIDDLDPWTVYDTVAVVMVQEYFAANSMSDELQFQDLEDTLGPRKFADFYRLAPNSTETILKDFSWMGAGNLGTAPRRAALRTSGFVSTLSQDKLEALRSTLSTIHSYFPFMRLSTGMSNNWVVGGALTASGRPMLANDPHLSCTDPPFFYLMDLDSVTRSSPGLPHIKAAGLTLPGAPGVAMGHNEHVAWGQTQLYYDVTDLYEEQIVTDGNGVITGVTYNGQTVPVIRKDIVYYLNRAHTKQQTKIMYIVPQHGPILDETIDLGAKKAYSMRWTGQTPTDDVKALMDLQSVTDVDNALATISHYDVGAYNFVFADTYGDIAYSGHAKVPYRPWAATYKPWLVLPGDGSAEWQGMIPDADIPWVKNPADHYIATANNDLLGTTLDNDPTNDKYYLYFDRAIGYRAMRIEKLIKQLSAGNQKIDFAAMASIQADNYSGVAFDLLPDCNSSERKLGNLTAKQNQALSYLGDWDYTTPAGVRSPFDTADPTDAQIRSSIATMIFHTWLNEIVVNTFGDELGSKLPGLSGESGPQMESKLLLFMLRHPGASTDEFWDDVTTPNVVETRDDIIQKSFAEAIDFLTSKLGDDMTAWSWGRLHTITFALAAEGITVPSDISPSTGPFPNDGALFTVDVANYQSVANKFAQVHCPQARVIYELDDTIKGEATLAVGQSMDPSSKYFNNMNQYWLTNTYVPLIFAPSDLTGKIDTRIDMQP